MVNHFWPCTCTMETVHYKSLQMTFVVFSDFDDLIIFHFFNEKIFAFRTSGDSDCVSE